MDKKKVSIIGIVGVPACYGGFETLVENLLNFPSDKIKYTVFCSSKNYQEKVMEYKNARLRYLNIPANGAASIIYDIFSMLGSLDSDLMLLLGVSGGIFLPLVRVLYKGKIVTNIDGIEWRRKKWKLIPRTILRVAERFAVRNSDVIIADNDGIFDYVDKTYGIKAEIIAYGADQAGRSHIPDNIGEFEYIKKPYAISVCRIEPENNVHLILEAFLGINKCNLVFVGNWRNSRYGNDLFERYSRCKNLFLLDPIYDLKKITYLRSHAQLYIHGHSAGGTNPSLVEAMHIGLPILAFDCIYNRATTENKADYWTDSNNLRDKVGNHNSQKNNGKRMRIIAKKKYTWKRISSEYNELIERVLLHDTNDKFSLDKK